MKAYNRTTSDITVTGASGVIVLPASDSDGVDGPEMDLTFSPMGRLVFCEAFLALSALEDADDIRIDRTIYSPPA